MKKSILILSLAVLGFIACTSNVPTESTSDSTAVDSTIMEPTPIDSVVTDSSLTTIYIDSVE